ncbi:MAG: Aspartate/glutamate/uridylate kinase [Candidatus Woesebacteria bacterium GW2011_GWA1_33_30]|uniref:Isopentenyl phosphate kinase n=1 Tax=Candidatus Woesebacteria bacterium GW2011_GWA2_33_28 TaxID=1618561 RepID=A0A0G0A6E1_9BACT|nr:MAG: Aspartate/glutamate/uridylate kinase [Candidatus Woesebacteria bacterium GW2011_GWA2_33_28]KKP47796.1 MAG: Aspartate/glutamate/uridylate kinase [Candidatus Woesebacteria bacterium GW2011_GWA1_33_30]KKP49241.1 MAG: Aspartate/glutamate/uridylate kinase [Microgenomates group bacterium GW2011_GWC1_33_32]KKP51608.1 MAG: Aspartate/glutamate/uridylate kinase [Candidatus Woesebacteria bacterium GW2011_GWB1_33_38]KKP56188.1 MAG: Aspartate/glutamate/uridylate kinase [Microgenomates group bacteriu
MKNLILVKLGGSVITDKSKPFTARTDVIKKLAKQIIKLKNKNTDLIVGHGSGSFAHTPAAKYAVAEGVTLRDVGLHLDRKIWGFSLTADAAIQINRIVVSEFLKLKLKVVSFAPMSFIYEKKIITGHIKKALDIGIIPVIYGDLVMDKKQGFHINSGEATLDLLAKKLSKFYKKIKIIYYTDTNGVYDANGKTIEKITPKNFKEIQKYITGSKNTDVTGGMILKVEESLKLVKSLDAEIYIMNGLSRGERTKICKN